jgi:hypothetical protein
MQRNSTRRSIKQLSALPTVQGGLSRLAADRVRRAGIKLEPLLSRVGLTIDQIDDPERRINAPDQIAFLQAAAEALDDDFLGLRLAAEFDLRDLGLLYYVMASSDTLGDALKRASRYSRITNEAVVLHYQPAREPRLRLTYLGSTPCRSTADRILHRCNGSGVSRVEWPSVLSQTRVHQPCQAERHHEVYGFSWERSRI